FNTRFGDPETQVVLPLLKNDFAKVLVDVLNGKDPLLQWRNQACAGVVVASKGYPGPYTAGIPLAFETPQECFLVHAGSKKKAGTYVSSGGRVLLVGAIGKDLPSAVETVYSYLEDYKENEDFFFRNDIGRKRSSEHAG